MRLADATFAYQSSTYLKKSEVLILFHNLEENTKSNDSARDKVVVFNNSRYFERGYWIYLLSNSRSYGLL